MKRLICIILVVTSILCLNGCFTEDQEKSVNFYYVRNSYVHGNENGVIDFEERKGPDTSDVQTILDQYLEGPQDASLVSPFPVGTKIVEFLFKGEELHITLSSHIVTLPKVKQVLACTCFARTAIELTGAKAVHFQSDHTTFTRMESITIDEGSFILYDNYTSTPADAGD